MSKGTKRESRYDQLAKKINLGIQIDEKNGQFITDWTPNNIKTLIIGIDMAIIGFYVTGGKFKHTFDGVNIQIGKINDYELIQDGKLPKSVLKVLTEGRVCSNIQEIIFISDKYPQDLLSHDSNLNNIASNNLKTKFPRLKYVGVVDNLPIQDALKIVKVSNKEHKLVEEILNDLGKTINKVEVNGEEYNKTYVVRPKHYAMDEKKLREYFLKEKEHKEEAEKEERLKGATIEKYGKDLKLVNNLLLTYLHYRNQILSASTMGFSDLTVLSKMEWGYMLEEKFNANIMAKEIRSKEKLLIDIRKINYVEVSNYLDELSLFGTNAIKFKDVLFKDILKNEDEYKREVNKYRLGESLTVLKGVIRELLELQSNIVYMIYSRYLAQNGVDYVLHFYNKVEQCVSPQQYTQKTSSLANKYLKENFKGQLNEVFKTIGGQEVLVKELNLKEMMEEATTIVMNYPRMG